MTECPSCGGLNLSCPEGCGRDPQTGELNGTRGPSMTEDIVERGKVKQIAACPFCDSKSVRASFVRISDEHQWHHVECGNCFAVGPHHALSSEAVIAWNSSTEAAEITRLRAQVETMKTALKEIEADYSNYEESGPVRLDRKRYIAQRALSVHRSTGASHE